MKYNIHPHNHTRKEAEMLEKMLEEINRLYKCAEPDSFQDGEFCGMVNAMNYMGYKVRYDIDEDLYLLDMDLY